MLYASADVFVLPSRGEGWGRPHVEAMAMGLPIITTNWSGPTEVSQTTHGTALPPCHPATSRARCTALTTIPTATSTAGPPPTLLYIVHFGDELVPAQLRRADRGQGGGLRGAHVGGAERGAPQAADETSAAGD